MAITVHSLASGSSGNSILIRDDNTSILIDAGIGIRKIAAGLEQAKVDPADLSAILITHEHSDHIAGALRMAKRYNVPLYSTASTLAHIDGAEDVYTKTIDAGVETAVGDLKVRPFSISHDAVCPVGYTIISSAATVCSVTDTGVITDEIREHAMNADLLILESNHDIEMLRTGPYPYYLKKRILGEKGHISNDTASSLLIDLAETGKDVSIWLAHLSQTNNTPKTALVTAQYLLWTCLGVRMDISVAKRDVPSLWWQRNSHQLKFMMHELVC